MVRWKREKHMGTLKSEEMMRMMMMHACMHAWWLRLWCYDKYLLKKVISRQKVYSTWLPCESTLTSCVFHVVFISHLLTNSSPSLLFPQLSFFLEYLFFIFFGFLFFNQISRGLGDDRQLYCLNILIIGDYVLLSTFSSFAFPFVYIYIFRSNT